MIRAGAALASIMALLMVMVSVQGYQRSAAKPRFISIELENITKPFESLSEEVAEAKPDDWSFMGVKSSTLALLGAAALPVLALVMLIMLVGLISNKGIFDLGKFAPDSAFSFGEPGYGFPQEGEYAPYHVVQSVPAGVDSSYVSYGHEDTSPYAARVFEARQGAPAQKKHN